MNIPGILILRAIEESDYGLSQSLFPPLYEENTIVGNQFNQVR